MPDLGVVQVLADEHGCGYRSAFDLEGQELGVISVVAAPGIFQATQLHVKAARLIHTRLTAITDPAVCRQQPALRIFLTQVEILFCGHNRVELKLVSQPQGKKLPEILRTNLALLRRRNLVKNAVHGLGD